MKSAASIARLLGLLQTWAEEEIRDDDVDARDLIESLGTACAAAYRLDAEESLKDGSHDNLH